MKTPTRSGSPKSKMVTLKHLAVGTHRWQGTPDEARIERNVFLRDGESWEALRFCKNRNGRHNRVHLVIDEEAFVDLFRDAVRNGVFSEATLQDLRVALGEKRDPFLDVIGISGDGKLAQGIDEELYGEDPA